MKPKVKVMVKVMMKKTVHELDSVSIPFRRGWGNVTGSTPPHNDDYDT